MNSQMALNTFDSALSIMAAAANQHAEGDRLTVLCSAFPNFESLLSAGGDYRPSLSRATPECRTLGALYDAAQISRGDHRRAFMYGNPVRKGSLIDRRNYVAADSWYRVGQRIAWWDRYTRQWIAYTLCSKGYQDGAADFYPNSGTLLRSEECHA